MSAKKVENYLQKIYKDAPKWMKRNSRYSNTSIYISTKLIQLMIKRNLSKRGFAKELGITTKKLNKYLSGNYDFTLSEIFKLGNFLKINISIK